MLMFSGILSWLLEITVYMASIFTKLMSNNGLLYICMDKCCILYLETRYIIIVCIYRSSWYVCVFVDF